MGRKPNQLIAEFFERGAKLEDASNRYRFTCRSCGLEFPKGRIDSLTNHLVKKCPALPLRDRQRAILQFHDLPADLPDMAQMTAGHSQTQNGPTMNLPFAPSKQGMSALETLAEVSRQHLDMSGKRGSGKHSRNTPPQSANGGGPGVLLDEFLIHDERPDVSDMSAVSQGIDMSGAPALPSVYQFNGPLQHSPASSPHLSNAPLSSSASMAQMVPSLMMAASAANELSNMMPLTNNLAMETELHMGDSSLSDKFFQSSGRPHWTSMPPSSIDPLLHESNRDQMLSKDDDLNKTASQLRPLAINPHGNSTQAHFTTDFSVSQKPSKPKVRGRFSDSRRREVQEVRKRGACIRCRMLKKPCSGDSPCNTCQNVESARLWKQPCIRTRIAEEFNLYSAGLHSVLGFHAISQAKSQTRLDQIPGRIEVSHFPESAIYATYTPLKSQAQVLPNTDIDPAIIASISPSALEIIDGEDDLGGKLDLYIKKVANHFYESEESAFMKTTLKTAFGITSPNQDSLLSKVLELWNLTRALTSRNLDWHIFSNPSLAPSMAPPTMSSSDLENSSRTPITALNKFSSYELIKLQLQGATEKRAANLARVVMNDLERRLLQRQQANPFETFLVAVILLVCVERMCWLFRTWEDQIPASSADATHQDVSNLEVQTSHITADDNIAQAWQSPPHADMLGISPRNRKWPFDKPPAYYSQQGERFSDILNMLLKMRGVPPKPTARSTDGMLVIWGDDADERVREWYDGIGITGDQLAERSNVRFVGEDPSEWELRYAGKIIGLN